MATYNSSGRIETPQFYNAGRLTGDIYLPEDDDDGEFDTYEQTWYIQPQRGHNPGCNCWECIAPRPIWNK